MPNLEFENKTPLVSVIIPAYNAEKYIADAIQSIVDQTYKNLEIIILDDASTDTTWNIIQSFVLQDKRIRAIKNEKNLYIAANRNKGLSLAKGKYIVWQDADDISLPERIQKEVAVMESDPLIGICGGYLQIFNETDGNLDIRDYPTDDSTLRSLIFKYSPVAQPAAIVRKQCFDELGNYDLRWPPAEDIDMSFRIGTKYKFSNVPEVVIYYRDHPGSSTYQRMKKQIRATLAVRKAYANHPRYNMSFSDKLAYVATWFSQFLPPTLTVTLFKKLRSILRSLGM